VCIRNVHDYTGEIVQNNGGKCTKENLKATICLQVMKNAAALNNGELSVNDHEPTTGSL